MENKNVYRVSGFSCSSCAAKFESNVKALPKVEHAQVNFGALKITVYGEASIKELEEAGAFEGIKVYPEDNKMGFERTPFFKRKSTIQTLASGVFLLLGYLAGDAQSALFFGLAILIGGYELFIKGFKGLIRFNFTMNTLMTIAILGAAAIGEWGEGATVVLLFAISEALETFSMDKARQSIRTLMNVAPKEALIRRGNQEMQIPVDDVQIGDVMIVKPGQKIAMDGNVIKGSSTVNQAAITGESLPVTKSYKDEVFAGSLNEEGLLEVVITKRVEDTTISKIIHLVEEAQAEKAPSQAFIDKFAKYYTPMILLAALLLAVIPPLLTDSWSEWIYKGLALLVVGCPCALVISTPVAIVTAIGTAARNGVLIKGGVYLEETGQLTSIAFDKTGTLTKGKPNVTDLVRLRGPLDNELLGIAASIEKWSQHPVASAIVRKAADEEVAMDAYRATGFSSITGKGAKAKINGTDYVIGNPRLFAEMGLLADETEDLIKGMQRDGKTVILLGTESDVLAVFAVADEIRNESIDIIRKLHELGIQQTVMLTGDNKETAHAVGKQIGIHEVQAELMPEDKLNAVKDLKTRGKVAMVGDGVNDAPALASATIGIAMGGAGTDTALETADIVLMADDLAKLPFTVKLSREALAIIKQNIAFSLLIKVAALLLIIPGWLTLWMAIFTDMGATLIVTLNSLRLLRKRD